MEGLQMITFYLRNNLKTFPCNSSFIFGSMYPPFHDDCSSEIVQQIIDYGSAVRSSVSKRSSLPPISKYQNIVSDSIGHNYPSLATIKSMYCQTSLVNTRDCMSRYLDGPSGTRKVPSGTRDVPSGTREVPSGTREVPFGTREVPSYNSAVRFYHPKVPPCAEDVCSGDHKCDIDPEPVDYASKQTKTPETSSVIHTNFSSKMQSKHQKKKRLDRIRLSLKLSCFRCWNSIKKSASRRIRPTLVENEIICAPTCTIPKPILKEFGTGMNFSPPKNAAIVTSKWLKNLNSKVLRDAAGATSGLTVKIKSSPILVSAFTSNDDMMKKKSLSKIYLQTGTQITKSCLANHKGVMAKSKTVSFNSGSSDVTKIWSTNQMLKQDCSVMTQTLGRGSIRPVLLSRSVDPRKSIPNLPVKFCPSKFAEVVVNRIIQNVPLKRQKQLKTQSCGTWTTPVKLMSFSTQPRSFHSSVNLNHHSLKLMSTKSSQGHYNIVDDRDLGTQNSRPDLPFCSSDLADKVAQKIIQHMQRKSSMKFDTQERGINVDTDCSASQPSKQEIINLMSEISGEPQENSQPSSDSSKLDSSSILRSRQDPESKPGNQSRCSSPPRDCDSKDSKTSRDGIVLNTGTAPKGDEDPESKPGNQSRCSSPPRDCDSKDSKTSRDGIVLNTGTAPKGDEDPESKPGNQSRCSSPPRDCDSKDSKTSRDGIVLNTGTAPKGDEVFDNKIEQLAAQIAAEVDKLKSLALKAYPMIHQTYFCDTKVKTPTCCERGVDVSKSMYPLITRPGDHKICQATQSTSLVGFCTCHASNRDHPCTKLGTVHVLGLSLCGSKSKMGDSNTFLNTKEIQVPLNKNESTQFIEAVSDDSDCDFSIVQYIGNLLSQKVAQVKCRFNKREEPLQAFAACQALFRAMQVCVRESSTEHSRHDIQSQTSIIEQVPVLTSTEVQRAIGETPPDKAIAYIPQAVWHTKVCTIHRGRRYESGESQNAWCVRMRQSCLVNHAFSVTNICSGQEKEDLRGVYYMLSAIEGRIRRVKYSNRMIS